MKAGIWILRFFIGAAILGAIALCSRTFAVVLVCSVILSAGLALIVWIPIACFLGFIVTEIFKGLFIGEASNLSKPAGERIEARMWDSQKSAVSEYVRKAKERGESTEEIRYHLLRNGWSPTFIEERLR